MSDKTITVPKRKREKLAKYEKVTKYLDRGSYKQIAKELGISDFTVRNVLHYGGTDKHNVLAIAIEKAAKRKKIVDANEEALKKLDDGN